MKSTKSKKNPYSEMTVKELKVLAEQSDAEAQFYLGVCYERGEGVRKNYKKAAEWYTKAAEQGDPEAIKGLEKLEKNVNGDKAKTKISENESDRLSKVEMLKEKIDKIFIKNGLEPPVWRNGEGYVVYFPKRKKK